MLNSELPATVRCHSVNQFNQGVYDIIVASDEKSLEQPGEVDIKTTKKQRKSSKRHKDKESGVARGIDFQFVSNVINFDFPLDISAYIHRAGRTARGNNQVRIFAIFLILFLYLKQEIVNLKRKLINYLDSVKLFFKNSF